MEFRTNPAVRPRIGVSACLLGERTRYDGDHRRDRVIVEELGGVFEWVSICPEVESGLGIPREPMQLEGDVEAPRLMTVESRRDLTERVAAHVAEKILEISKLDLCGFLLKKGSPSCGPAGVRVFPEGGPAAARILDVPALSGIGLLARGIEESFPDLPCMDEEMIADRQAAARFTERALALWRSRTPSEPRTSALEGDYAPNT